MSQFSAFDHHMMQLALKLAEKGQMTTYPNPNVGCVITQGDQIVGQGFHRRAGEPHAEVYALREADELAKGSTVYVTLEPCSHHGRTPPCADALIKAGVQRVVCAMEDPNPQVAGRGIRRLQAAGIQVEVGLLAEQAAVLNCAFIKKMSLDKPFVQLKMASSLDGRTALANGQSQWITGEQARQDVQVFRAKAGAVLSTATTVIADNAALNVRWHQLPRAIQETYLETDLRQPTRVILDRKGQLTPDLRLFQSAGDILILTQNPDFQIDLPQVRIIHVSKQAARFELAQVLEILNDEGIYHLWVEAGATLATSFLEQQLVDELILYQAPTFMGSDARPLSEFHGISTMAELKRLRITKVCQLGDDIRLNLMC